MLGERFEAEIREQPDVWRRIATSAKAAQLAQAIGSRRVCLVGSGSSLFVAQLGALALRRRGIAASALAAAEAGFDFEAYRDACVVAFSQSGRSSDVVDAVEQLRPTHLIAITNAPQSPLAARAHTVIDIDAGPERAVPASKSVTAMVAIVLWAAAILEGASDRTGPALAHTADVVEAWLHDEGWEAVAAAAERLAHCRSVVIAGSGYGVPIAYEVALKIKEASYVHAEGFSAGEFRHGSSAILDASCGIVGLVEERSRDVLRRPLERARAAESVRYVIGATLEDLPVLGPLGGDALGALGWLVAGQVLALSMGRARQVQSDTPRGLAKFLA